MREFQSDWTDDITDDEVIDAIKSLPTHFADYTVVAANVLQSTGGSVNNSYAGSVALTQGQVVYLNTSTTKWALATAAGTALQSGNGTVYGIVLNACAANQPVAVFIPTPGSTCKINTGVAVTVVGTMVVVSAAVAGNMAPQADLGAGNYFTFLGWWTTTGGILDMFPSQATGLTKA